MIIEDPNYVGKRLIGEPARRKYGNLFPLASSTIHYDSLVEAAETWRDYISARDPADYEKFVKLTDFYAMDEPPSFEDIEKNGNKPDAYNPYQGYWDVYFNSESAYRRLAYLETPQYEVYQIKPVTRSKHYEQFGMRWPTHSVCYCVEKSCEGLWPISTKDIFLHEKLPYICAVGRL